MTWPVFRVDAFTGGPFAGNPAAVCLLDRPAPDGWMQKLAAEMNLSETAFLLPEGDGWRLRWFTPTVEVKLCGHATLAAAHVLWETGRAGAADEIRFRTHSGTLTARRAGEWIELDFPAQRVAPTHPPPGLVEALGVQAAGVHNCSWTWLVHVESPAVVRHMRPDLRALKDLPFGSAIVTSPSDIPQYDFLSRFFAPGAGIDEDPVTGSAHCCLAAFWSPRLGKADFVAYQASKRGGVVKVRLAGDRAILGGQAVTVWSGELAESALAAAEGGSTMDV